MKISTLTFTVTVIILTTSLFQGCSGHALQDLIDGKNDDDTSSKENISSRSDQQKQTPSENRALNSISPTSTANDKHKEHRYIQKNVNSWSINEKKIDKKEEASVTESNINKYDNNASNENNRTVDDNSSFTLQHYVDVLGDYMEEKERLDVNKTKKPSNIEKLESMPGIGTSKKRR